MKLPRRKFLGLIPMPLVRRKLGENEAHDWEVAHVSENRSRGLTKDQAYRLFEATKDSVWTDQRVEIRHKGQVIRVHKGQAL